jgi:hypothetical protein
VFVFVYEGVCMCVQMGCVRVCVHVYVCEFVKVCMSECVHVGVCFCRFQYAFGYVCECLRV